jgi:hypothetical protein
MILKPHERRCVDFSNRCCDRCFGKVVGSAVDDIIMPVVGLLTGGVDFTIKFIAKRRKLC